MNTAEKLIEVAENTPKVHEAGKKWAYENPKTPTDGRMWMCEWYAGLNRAKGFIWDQYYDGERGEYINPEEDESTHMENIEYPKGTQNAENFAEAISTRRWNDETLCDEMIAVPTKKFTGFLDMTSATDASYMFGYGEPPATDAGTIVFSNHECNYTRAFDAMTSLKKLKAQGSIKSTISFRYSPLDRESITSIVNALDTEAAGETCTFKKTAKEAAFTDDEWETLIATKTNWEILLK